MKIKFKAILLGVALFCGATANAQGLGDLLNSLGGNSGSDLGSTVGNVLSGIFTKTDLTVQDIAGSYVSDGPAISFKSDNFLQKAGGLAGAAALETKLKPYYEKYGLIGMPLTIDNDGNFTLSVKAVKLSGTVEAKDNKGVFVFNIKVAGKMKIGQFTAYIQKSGKNIDLMFDAKKLKNLISSIAKLSGQSLVSSMGKLLDSYDGANIGFSMKYSGAADGGNSTVTTSSTEEEGSVTDKAVDAGVNALKDILSKKKK